MNLVLGGCILSALRKLHVGDAIALLPAPVLVQPFVQGLVSDPRSLLSPKAAPFLSHDFLPAASSVPSISFQPLEPVPASPPCSRLYK